MTSMKTRFAPSPTGLLHLGNVRTALFNWLCAKSTQGIFLLRIEDTDQERSRKEYVDALKRDLTWLGLTWSEGPDVGGPHAPYHQSQRKEILRAIHLFCREHLEVLQRLPVKGRDWTRDNLKLG